MSDLLALVAAAFGVELTTVAGFELPGTSTVAKRQDACCQWVSIYHLNTY